MDEFDVGGGMDTANTKVYFRGGTTTSAMTKYGAKPWFG